MKEKYTKPASYLLATLTETVLCQSPGIPESSAGELIENEW